MSDEGTVETTGAESSSVESTPTAAFQMPAEKTESTPATMAKEGRTPLGVFAGQKSVQDSNKAQAKVGRPLGSKNQPKVDPAAPVYEPNYKFKVLDQEKEMDEWLRPLVKNKEVEDKIRDMLTKVHGLPKIKSERDEVRTQFDTFKSQIQKEYAPVIQRHQHLSEMASKARQNDDWTPFLQAAQIPVQSVIKWAAKTVAQLEANPNHLDKEKALYDTTQHIQSIQQQNQTLQQQMDQIRMERQALELDYNLNANDTKEFAKIFDARVGRPGAFRQEVINRGAMIEMSEGRVATAQELVGDLIKLYGGMPKAEVPMTEAPAEQAQMEGSLEAQQGSDGKPVLPNIKGRSTSPAKTVIRSTDDLRKLRTQLVG